jgi:Tfp pilus assembly protein PilF
MLELCLKEAPLLIEAQLLQAGFAEEAGDLALAEQACRRALYIDPSAAIAHFHLALILGRKGDRTKAARSLATTLKLIDGKDPHALVEHGEGVCNGRLKEMVSVLMDF